MRLKNKVAFITGAGTGIGRESALLFAREGAQVVVFDVNKKAGKETADYIVEEIGREALFVPGDVTREKDVRAAVAKAAKTFGAIHVLFACAGVLWKDRDKSVIETTVENWDLVQAVNLRGPFLLTKHGIPEVRKAGGGSIILVGSISALAGFTLAQDSYTCAKGAMLSLAKSLAVQFGPDNIRCNVIHPGMISTPLQHAYFSDDELKEIGESLPIRRIGQPQDIAGAALFLASDESSFMTGAEMIVDGGFMAT